MMFRGLTSLEEEIGKAIVNAAFKVHRDLGPGLLEKVYEVCVAHELRKTGYDVKRQWIYPFVMTIFSLMKDYD
jgi:GxxExxY protein